MKHPPDARDAARSATGALPPDVLEVPIRGLGITGRTLGEELGEGPTLLAFLRHLG